MITLELHMRTKLLRPKLMNVIKMVLKMEIMLLKLIMKPLFQMTILRKILIFPDLIHRFIGIIFLILNKMILQNNQIDF